jgi:hypothetical protein
MNSNARLQAYDARQYALHGVRSVVAACANCGRSAGVNVDLLPETLIVPEVGKRLRCSNCGGKAISTRPLGIRANGKAFLTISVNGRRCPRPPLRRSPPARLLQTGTGTAQTTAINTAAITAAIFSLVGRPMASSGAMPISAPLHTRPWAFTL